MTSHDWNCSVAQLTRDRYLKIKDVGYFDQLSKDIQDNGLSTPLKVSDGVLVDGHHRAIIAMELDLKEVPIEYCGKLPPTCG